MKVAVTGASGFIGGHVLNALARHEDLEIVAVSRREIPADRLPAGAAQAILDIAAPTEADFDRLGRPDVLMHLAWDGLPNYQSPHHIERELPAQYRFLRMLIEGGLRALLVTGTCYEYGMLGGELGEERVAEPASPYASAKIALHRQLELLKASTPFALTWARLFYTWGPGQASGSIFPQLCAAVERGDARFPMSPGEQIRDYLAVEEMARILVALALRREDSGAVNVCSGMPVRLRAQVEQWLAEYGWKIALDLGRYPYPDHEPLAFWGSVEKLERLLADSA